MPSVEKKPSIDELYSKLKEIENLIHDSINPDGTPAFDTYRVMVSLELARRMVSREENSDTAVDGHTKA